LQVQIYVGRRAKDLSEAIAGILEAPKEIMKSLRWTAPREEQRFGEPYDGRFLEALGLPEYKTRLAEFWPEGGPHWDALAVAGEEGPPSLVLLVEGKSYPGEVYGPGCQATAESSKRLISAALDRTRYWQRAQIADWTGTCSFLLDRGASSSATLSGRQSQVTQAGERQRWVEGGSLVVVLKRG
jgi:hypothetical protein